MKPILVLGPEEEGVPSLERCQADFCRLAPLAEVVAGPGAYSSVIVINDGGADTLRRVQLAMDMCGRGQKLSVGVLTYLAAADATDAVTLADWLALWGQLRSELKGAVVSLEYQAD